MSIGERWRGKNALVTGASSGIGAEFARLLAREGCHLVLAARRRERLENLRTELAGPNGVKIDIVVADLADPEGAGALFDEVCSIGRPVDLLVNNAGFGIDGPFKDIDWREERRMIQLNAVMPVELTKRFLPAMIERRSGDILFVSSIAAFLSIPTFATYAATKAFLTRFGEAIGHELRGTGVRVSVLHPGGTATEFLEAAGMKPTKLTHLGQMSAESVARIGLEAMARGRLSPVAGAANAVMIWFASRFLPLGLSLRAGALFQKIAGGGRGKSPERGF